MGIGILIFFICFFEFKLKKYSPKFKYKMHAALLIYIIFSIILNIFLENAYNWENGIPGVDLSAYYNVAKGISDGINLNELYKIDYRFEYNISGFGYILYAAFIALVSFSPTIISTKFSLQIVYIIQSIIAIISAVNLAEFFAKDNKEKKTVLIMFLSCICVCQMSSLLMRDIWVLFFISMILYEGKKERPNKILGIILIILSLILRIYTVFITVPFFIMYYMKKNKAAFWASIGILGIFILGQGIIRSISSIYNIGWKFEFNFQISSIVKYLLFPNIITQTHEIQNMCFGYHLKFGGNTEWIYYILSCWNLFIYPIVGLGIIKSLKNKEKKYEKRLWLLQMINISLLYSVFYEGISEPRHKLLILYGLIYFFLEGINSIKRKYWYFYVITLILGILLLFLFIN